MPPRFQAAETLFMTNPLLQFLLSEQFTFPTWKEKNSLQEKKNGSLRNLTKRKRKKKTKKTHVTILDYMPQPAFLVKFSLRLTRISTSSQHHV